MAGRIKPLDPLAKVGVPAAGILLALAIAPVVAVAWRAEGAGALRAADWAAIRFTLIQAALSASLSVTLAIPIARALARRSFRGRRALVVLMGAPFILPAIVAVLGLLSVFGREGVVNAGLGILGLEPIGIFGLGGVVLAHVYLNLPLAVRVLLLAWERIPGERIRLAASLGFGPGEIARQFHVPLLRETLPGAFAVIFLICTTSFAVALTLGGGPRATTVELAIYQAFRFDFDLARAARLALIQLAIGAGAALILMRLALPQDLGAGLDRRRPSWPGLRRRDAVLDGGAILLAAAFLILPLAFVVLRGAPEMASLPSSVWAAAARSLILALSAAALAVGLSLTLASLMAAGRARGLVEAVSYLGVAVSPLVIGTGLFLLIRQVVDPTRTALVVTGVLNAVAALPFMLRGLAPALAEAMATQGRLATSLGLGHWQRWRYGLLPRIARPLGFGAGLAAALSMGDLGVIALFPPSEGVTLPLEMYRQMGSYRSDTAAGTALLLLGLSLGLFWLLERLGRSRAAS